MTDDLRPLPGSDKPAPAGMRALGPVPGTEPVTVSIYLKPREGDGGFEHRAAMARARAEAHAEDFAAIGRFAEANGLAVVETDPARRLVKLTGPAAAMQRAFGTELHAYDMGGFQARVRSGPLHLPGPVVDRVLAVLGLDTRPVATPKIVPHRSATPPAGHLPSEVAVLYGFAGSRAPGQCVAIIELGGGYRDADNRAAFKAMGLPVPPILAVPIDGAANAPGGDADGEVALDIQVVGGIARGAKLAVYFAPNTAQGFTDAISLAVHDARNKPSAVSISWGGPENGWTGQAIAAMSAAFADAAALGVTVTAASGDALATDGVADGKPHVDYPASDPAVLGCGGTRLDAAGGRLIGEAVWNSNGGGTGGGVSALFAKPAYQKNVAVPKRTGRKGGRGVPDVAADADPDTGFRIVVGGRTGIIGGTSAAAPLWAGIAAVLNEGRARPIGRPHDVLYAHPETLRDVTRGDNRAGTIGYAAGPGWDACTGLGSPDGARLRALFGKG